MSEESKAAVRCCFYCANTHNFTSEPCKCACHKCETTFDFLKSAAPDLYWTIPQLLAVKKLLEERDAARKINQMLLAEIEAGGRMKQAVEMERDALLAAAKRAKKLLEPELVKEPDRTIFWELVAAIALVEGRKVGA